MRRKRFWLLALCAAPFVSWAYFRFIHYPVELERHTQGPYSVIVLAEPTSIIAHPVALLMQIPVVFGSIHNCTQIRAELWKEGRRVDTAVLASGEDLPGDHVPVDVRWTGDTVTVTERERRGSAAFVFSPKKPGK